MNLLELMVEHGVQWPKSAQLAMQDGDGEVKFSSGDSATHSGGGIWIRADQSVSTPRAAYLPISSNSQTALITREQYEQAVKKQHTEEAKEFMDTAKAGVLSDIETPIQHEIGRTISTLSEADISDEAAEVIVEHLRVLLMMRRSELKTDKCLGKLTVNIDADEAIKALRDKIDSEPQLTITDWRDLRVGDVVEVYENTVTLTSVVLDEPYGLRFYDGTEENGYAGEAFNSSGRLIFRSSE